MEHSSSAKVELYCCQYSKTDPGGTHRVSLPSGCLVNAYLFINNAQGSQVVNVAHHVRPPLDVVVLSIFG